jgi:hypothetical protein
MIQNFLSKTNGIHVFSLGFRWRMKARLPMKARKNFKNLVFAYELN